MIGVRPDGTKELVALEDGYRESTDSWAEVLRDVQRRGPQAPVVAVGDGVVFIDGVQKERNNDTDRKEAA